MFNRACDVKVNMGKQQEQSVIDLLTLDEKLALQTGSGCWNTAAVERLGIQPVSMSDGPVGLRKVQNGETLPAVCFPSIAKLACSFDPDTLREVGSAIGEQCRAENVDILLAPGINIKRDPRCGRNFEYFSEDPLLTAELAKAYVAGVNSQGVGVCVKHFAANNQEYGRFVVNSVVDERALREIYLAAFEKVIKQTNPCSVMCAYNRLNGEYCSENKRLLGDILRGEWGYQGLVMSDWGAVNDRVKSLRAGLDLEMPQGYVHKVKAAAENGELNGDILNAAVSRVAELSTKFDRTRRNVDFDYQHQLVAKLSADTTVLAKNNCKLLPLSATDSIALIGHYAKEPAFSGGGSSRVVPYKTDSIFQAMRDSGIEFSYAEGYNGEDLTCDELLGEAQSVAANADRVILVVGEKNSCEGKDNYTWSLPEGQLKAIDAVTSANSNVVIVLQTGAGVNVSWAHAAKALLIDYYGGEHGGKAMVDVIFGNVAPTGRLAETWYSCLPSFSEEFSLSCEHALYKESIFVGYRYTSTANVAVEFPFGYGLSYSDMEISEVKFSHSQAKLSDKTTVSLVVKNHGKKSDAEVIQVYATNLDGRQFTAKKNLIAFKKVRLKGGESKKVIIPVNLANLAYYNIETGAFEVNGGKYLITVGRNVCDDKYTFTVQVAGDNNTKDLSDVLPSYYNVGEDFSPSDNEFATLYDREIEIVDNDKYNISSSLSAVQQTKFGKRLVKRLVKNTSASDIHEVMAYPLRSFINNGLSAEMLDTAIDILNGDFWHNIVKYIKQYFAYRKTQRNK